MTHPESNLWKELGLDPTDDFPAPPPGVWESAIAFALDPSSPEVDSDLVPEMDDVPQSYDSDLAADEDAAALVEHHPDLTGDHPDLGDALGSEHDDQVNGHHGHGGDPFHPGGEFS